MVGYDYLKKFFKEENFHYMEEDAFISFKIEGVNYHAFKQDTPYLQIIIICNTEGQSRSKILEVCNSMNQDKYVVKFTVTQDSDRVWCSYEFQPTENTASDDFMVIFRLLDKSSDEFFERLQK